METEDNGKKQAEEPNRVVYEFKVTELANGDLELRPSGQYLPVPEKCLDRMKRLSEYLECQRQAAMTVKMMMDVQERIRMEASTKPRILRPN
jgi:hypothetical protein